MIFDHEHEDMVRLSEINTILPEPINPVTGYRWYKDGVAGQRLETIKIGRARWTSRQAVSRFCERVTAATERGGQAAKQTAEAKGAN